MGTWLVNYTVASNCFETFTIVDTVYVKDDVRPKLIAISDPCVNLLDWATFYNSNPLDSARNLLETIENCGIDSIYLLDLDSMFFPDDVIRDSVLYTYTWYAEDIYGNLSDTVSSIRILR